MCGQALVLGSRGVGTCGVPGKTLNVLPAIHKGGFP